MAYVPTGKVVVNSTREGKAYSENLGYTHANLMNDSLAADKLLTFTQSLITDLTTHSYSNTEVEYTVVVDEVEYEEE